MRRKTTSPENTRLLFDTILLWIEQNYPLYEDAALVVNLKNGKQAVLPVGLTYGHRHRAGPEPTADQSGPGAEPFVPTGFQQEILEALEGKALRSDALGHAVNDRSRLFRHPGGLKELREHDLVSHHPRLGYYRADAPPEELSPDQSGTAAD